LHATWLSTALTGSVRPCRSRCRQAAGGIGISCSQAGGAKTNDALQPKKSQSRTKLGSGGQTNSD